MSISWGTHQITLRELNKECTKFKNLEGRAGYYDMARRLLPAHPLEACVLLSATWNMGRFRYFLSDKKTLEELERVIQDTEPIRQRLKGKKFQETNFDDKEIKQDVFIEYLYFSQVKGVEYTGASKLMHLFNPELYVMWDTYIRKLYHYGTSENDYLEFQKVMQRQLWPKWTRTDKPLAKAIDEYNYMNISWPELQKEKEKRKGG
jgi:hypothetical protein